MSQQTPIANRTHIAIYGKRNAGKSALLNAIVGQDVSLVSSVKGTTTDPVNKTMELIPFGPVVFIDTAGLDDEGELGEMRVERSLKVLQRTDLALYVMDINNLNDDDYRETIAYFKRFNIPHLTVINKIDTVKPEELTERREEYPGAAFVSSLTGDGILDLKDALINTLQAAEAEPPLIGDLVAAGGTVVMVVPVDSEAPKGRIILPQVQLIRDCLDHGIKSYVVRDIELASALQDLKHIDLVVTDSQAFRAVSEIVPPEIKLTSFSMLFARYKGDLKAFLAGVETIPNLPEGANILIAESCSHNHSHEDIGRVKIPKLMQGKSGKKFNFNFCMGHDYPDNLEDFSMVIHCGSCMLNKKSMDSRIRLCTEKGVPITNYGVVLAYLNGILPRTTEIFSGHFA